MLDQLAAHCGAVDRNPDLRVVLNTAADARAFCTRADIAAWGDLPTATFARAWLRDGQRIFDRLARLSKPTIAVLQGHAFGGGLELAAACDIRVMARDAMLVPPEAGVGIVPGWSGTQRLEAPSRATEVAKYMIHAASGEDRAAMIKALGSGMIAASDDKAAGVAAFHAKQKPIFPGT